MILHAMHIDFDAMHNYYLIAITINYVTHRLMMVGVIPYIIGIVIELVTYIIDTELHTTLART